ncbi:MAG: hypothetical protein OXN90_03695 [Gemmatimonadota bacterium]|nr:hypothetical protein [Gemmatimonadota bacterium]
MTDGQFRLGLSNIQIRATWTLARESGVTYTPVPPACRYGALLHRISLHRRAESLRKVARNGLTGQALDHHTVNPQRQSWRNTMASKQTKEGAEPTTDTGRVPKRKTIAASKVGLSLTISDKTLKEFDRKQEETIKAAEKDQNFSWG